MIFIHHQQGAYDLQYKERENKVVLYYKGKQAPHFITDQMWLNTKGILCLCKHDISVLFFLVCVKKLCGLMLLSFPVCCAG